MLTIVYELFFVMNAFRVEALCKYANHYWKFLLFCVTRENWKKKQWTAVVCELILTQLWLLAVISHNVCTDLYGISSGFRPLAKGMTAQLLLTILTSRTWAGPLNFLQKGFAMCLPLVYGKCINASSKFTAVLSEYTTFCETWGLKFCFRSHAYSSLLPTFPRHQNTRYQKSLGHHVSKCHLCLLSRSWATYFGLRRKG